MILFLVFLLYCYLLYCFSVKYEPPRNVIVSDIHNIEQNVPYKLSFKTCNRLLLNNLTSGQHVLNNECN